jgi:hypothetical protein
LLGDGEMQDRTQTGHTMPHRASGEKDVERGCTRPSKKVGGECIHARSTGSHRRSCIKWLLPFLSLIVLAIEDNAFRPMSCGGVMVAKGLLVSLEVIWGELFEPHASSHAYYGWNASAGASEHVVFHLVVGCLNSKDVWAQKRM